MQGFHEGTLHKVSLFYFLIKVSLTWTFEVYSSPVVSESVY